LPRLPPPSTSYLILPFTRTGPVGLVLDSSTVAFLGVKEPRKTFPNSELVAGWVICLQSDRPITRRPRDRPGGSCHDDDSRDLSHEVPANLVGCSAGVSPLPPTCPCYTLWVALVGRLYVHGEWLRLPDPGKRWCVWRSGAHAHHRPSLPEVGWRPGLALHRGGRPRISAREILVALLAYAPRLAHLSAAAPLGPPRPSHLGVQLPRLAPGDGGRAARSA